MTVGCNDPQTVTKFPFGDGLRIVSGKILWALSPTLQEVAMVCGDYFLVYFLALSPRHILSTANFWAENNNNKKNNSIGGTTDHNLTGC